MYEISKVTEMATIYVPVILWNVNACIIKDFYQRLLWNSSMIHSSYQQQDIYKNTQRSFKSKLQTLNKQFIQV